MPMIVFLIGRRFLTVLPTLKSMGFPFLYFSIWAFIMNKGGDERDDPCDIPCGEMGSIEKGNLSERWWIPTMLSQERQPYWRDYSEEIHCKKCCTQVPASQMLYNLRHYQFL